jgi:hypothetical protein
MRHLSGDLVLLRYKLRQLRNACFNKATVLPKLNSQNLTLSSKKCEILPTMLNFSCYLNNESRLSRASHPQLEPQGEWL